MMTLNDDTQRRNAWVTIQAILKYEASFLTEDQRQRLEIQAIRFLGNSLHDRIRRFVGRRTIVDTLNVDHLPEDQRPPAVVARLADEALQEPDILRGELPWLLSREAEYAWHFGYRLGVRDETHYWLDELTTIAKVSDESLLLSAYLQARADMGEDEWREHLLDEWMQDASYAGLIFDVIWHDSANTRAVQRLIALVDRDILVPVVLRRLVYGGWICSLSAPDVLALLERLVRDTSSVASEAGLALLTQWIEAQKQELPVLLVPIAWTLVERSVAESTQMLDFYWKEVGLLLMQKDPIRITRTVLSGIATGDITFTDERLTLLSRAFALKPTEIWEVFANYLVQDEGLSYGLREWFKGNGLLDELDADVLLTWARQEPERRSRLLARLLKPKEVLSPLIQGLLKEYGPESVAADILTANFHTGVWWGSWSQHESQQIAIMKGWVRDSELNVRLWAQRLITDTQQHLPEIRRKEEEEWN